MTRLKWLLMPIETAHARPVCVVLLLALLAGPWGCASTGSHVVRLHAEDGRKIQAGLAYTGTGSGTFWVQFPDGEFLTGEFSTTTDHEVSPSLLATPWGPITTVSLSQAGPEALQFTAAGNRGTSLQCISFPRGSRGVGGCRDSRARSYELYH